MFIISDLDKTLIFSDREKNFLNNKEYICVEYKNNEPLSYMTNKAYEYLQNLSNNYCFIPCTMRSFEQFNRIHKLKELNPKYIICYNGCELYIDNQLDLEYNEYIESIINKNETQKLHKILSEKYNHLRVQTFKDYYIEIKCDNLIEKEQIHTLLLHTDYINEYDIFIVSKKIYIIPKLINKQLAIDYLNKKVNLTKIYALGDSIIDKDFVHAADFGFVPNHCEFPLVRDTIYRSSYDGILGGEDILKQLSNNLIF